MNQHRAPKGFLREDLPCLRMGRDDMEDEWLLILLCDSNLRPECAPLILKSKGVPIRVKIKPSLSDRIRPNSESLEDTQVLLNSVQGLLFHFPGMESETRSNEPGVCGFQPNLP